MVNSSSNNVVSEVNTTPGYSYGGITYDAFDGLLATTAGNNCTFLPQDCSPSLVSFVDPSTDSYIGSLQIGQALGGLAFDPANDELYVTDGGGNVVYAIFPPRTPTHYGLDFEETGLPGGSSWSVNLQGTYGWRTQSSTDGSNTFLSNNGSFMFQITAPTGYSTSPSNGTINVSGSSLVVHIKFTQNPWPMALPLVIVLVVSVAIGAAFVWYRKKRRHPKALTTCAFTNRPHGESIGLPTYQLLRPLGRVTDIPLTRGSTAPDLEELLVPFRIGRLHVADCHRGRTPPIPHHIVNVNLCLESGHE
jgi:hypothetical protein